MEQEPSPAEGRRTFIGYLKQAREMAWNPSAAWLARQSRISQSTVESLIGGRRTRLPDWNTQVEPLLAAYRCKVADDQRGHPDAVLGTMSAWKQAYDDAQNTRPITCPLPVRPVIAPPADQRNVHQRSSAWEGTDLHGPGRPIKQVRAVDLEVHPAIDAGAVGMGLDTLPAYINRAHDEALAAVVQKVRDHGDVRMRVLVGGSSTGKTRTCWEAVRHLPPPWRLWHPLRPDRPEAALTDLENVGPHTVVWLNEAQHYLLTPVSTTGEQVAAGIRELLASPKRGPVLVLGTLWPQYWDLLTAVPTPGKPDPHAQARDLLKNVSIRIPDAFTGSDLDAATVTAEKDPRLAEALRHASSGALTQYLAGGPALIERYDKAALAARALLHAAMDARRLGHEATLPRLLLEEAAAGYLSDDQWDLLADDWLEKAFAYLTDPLPCRGARPPLTRIKSRPGTSFVPTSRERGEPFYRLADYLEQHGAQARRLVCPPAGFWDAATRHAATSRDHTALAQAADDRGRYRHAFALWQRAADAGDNHALHALARLRDQVGDHEGAERLARAAADIGNSDALYNLARARKQSGSQKEAKRLYLLAADTGNSHALYALAELREQAGDREGAERLARAATDASNTNALRALAQARKQLGEQDGAERLARAAADASDPFALRTLAQQLEQADEQDGAERLARAAADLGNSDALYVLARMRERAGDHEGAERLARAATDIGNTNALRALARMR
ncbi:tetratricopeptide repeat protein, partial [Streptosporangium sp. NPDC087985]|uniref:tetratricopeptide repeat protein n=1 Tax=Streptosporangium sp. NPDC087985 TaxID=3366196 RepID=UPI0038247EA2